MTDPDILQTILKDSSFDLSLFSVEEINALRQRIFIKAARGKDTAFVTCIVRGKDIQLKPEEIVRQLYADIQKKTACFLSSHVRANGGK